MRTRVVIAVAFVVLLVSVTAGAVELSRLRAERNDARADLGVANVSLATANARLDVMTGSRARYERLANHRLEVVHGLRGQVDRDKSHLLDCWTALVRVVPSNTMKEVFGRPLGYLADAARDGGVLAHYVRRCAADAVP